MTIDKQISVHYKGIINRISDETTIHPIGGQRFDHHYAIT